MGCPRKKFSETRVCSFGLNFKKKGDYQNWIGYLYVTGIINIIQSVFYCSAGVKANFKCKKLKNSQRFNNKLTAPIRAERSKMS